MVRTRSNAGTSGGRGNKGAAGRGRGIGNEEAAGRGRGRGAGRGVGRGAGRGEGRGRGRGEAEGEAANNQAQMQADPAMIAMITQVVNAVLAQNAQNANQNANQTENYEDAEDTQYEEGQYEDTEDEKGGNYYENVDQGNRMGNVPRRPRTQATFVTYKMFKDGGVQDYDGKGGAVKFSQWLEKMEAVINISGCTPDQRVRYVANSFILDALSWWNTQCSIRGRAVAEAMPWIAFKELMMRKFCTATELLKLEREFQELKMIGADHATYTARHNELARLVVGAVSSDNFILESLA